MKKKSIAIATVISAFAWFSTATKASAFQLTTVTPNPDGPTFILNQLDENDYRVKSIQNLEIFNEKYDVSFVSGSYEDLNNQGLASQIPRSYSSEEAVEAHNSIATALLRLISSNRLFISALEDSEGNERDEWSIIGGGNFWWVGLWDGEYGYGGLRRVGPFGGSGLLFNGQTYTTFTKSVLSSTPVPEPITVLGSLTALGFGIAMKKKLASVQK